MREQRELEILLNRYLLHEIEIVSENAFGKNILCMIYLLAAVSLEFQYQVHHNLPCRGIMHLIDMAYMFLRIDNFVSRKTSMLKNSLFGTKMIPSFCCWVLSNTHDDPTK